MKQKKMLMSQVFYSFLRIKIKQVEDVLCGGSLKFMQLTQLRSRYHSVYNKVRSYKLIAIPPPSAVPNHGHNVVGTNSKYMAKEYCRKNKNNTFTFCGQKHACCFAQLRQKKTHIDATQYDPNPP